MGEMTSKWNSSIYNCKVIHSRMTGSKTQFSYSIFTFLMDLDELDELSDRFWIFSRNRFSLFSFYDSDHLQFEGCHDTKSGIVKYLRDQGYTGSIGKIFLLTNLRVLGYVFNPVSFYYVFDEDLNPVTAIAEVGNTFGELKPYFFGIQEKPYSSEFYFRLQSEKFFYVSPFIPLDSKFDFKLQIPTEKLRIQVDSWEMNHKTLGTAYIGKKNNFTTKNLILNFIKHPFVTVKIISAIHFQAMVLFIKKIPFIRKDDNPDQQIGVHFGKGNR